MSKTYELPPSKHHIPYVSIISRRAEPLTQVSFAGWDEEIHEIV